MLRLYYSNRLEDLLAPLAESVHAQQARDPLEPVTIVVPGRVMAQYVKFELAERLGVAANLRFPFLQDHLDGLIRQVEPELGILDRRRLELLLFQRLGIPAITTAPELAPVKDYLGLASSPSDRALRRLQLARELSGLFLEYAFSRRELIARWGRGPQLGGTPYQEPERWERALWRSLFDERGSLAGGSMGEPPSRWQLLPDAFEEIAAERFDGLPPAHFFGLSYLAPAFSRVFAKLAERIDLRMYATVPCLEFSEDSADDVEARSRVSRSAKLPHGALMSPDPFGLSSEEGNRIVSLWARPGREHLRMLNEVGSPELIPCFASPATVSDPHVLSTIQSDILFRVPGESIRARGPAEVPDGSIRFLACPGIRREIEIVAARIWSLVSASPRHGRERLRFHEIGVMLPESAEDAYFPHVEAVFREVRNIPVNLLSRPLQSESRLVEAVESLLALPLGRFDRQEMVRLLTHPCVGTSDRDADRERWRAWCEDLSVVFGADRDDLTGTFIHPRDLYNWDQGLRRLALGVFMAGGPSGVDEIFGEGDRECIPWEVPQGEAPDAARLVSLARLLISEARFCRNTELRPAEWAELLMRWTRTYIQPSNEADGAVRQACIDVISGIAVELEREPVPYEVAHALITAALSDVQAHSGRLTRRGVAVGTLRSMRTVPFKVIFAMGLGESVFPAQESGDALDLRQAERRAGDASVAERDRYLFLETLLAARQRLFLSYVARDGRTGEKLEPSTVIRELQFLLRDYVQAGKVESMTEGFPVTRYSASGSAEQGDPDPDGNLPGVDIAAVRGGRFRKLGEDLRRHLGGTLPPDRETILRGLAEIPDAAVRDRLLSGLKLPKLPDRPAAREEVRRLEIPLTALRRFLECPLQGAAQYGLRIFEDGFDSGEEAEEPLEGTILERTILAREAFREAAGDPRGMAEDFEKAHRRAVLLGTAPTGPFGDAERAAILTVLANWQENAGKLGLHDLSEWGAVQIGRAHESATVKETLPPIVIDDLELPRPGGGVEKITVSLYGATELVSPRADAAVRCVLKARGKLKARDYLPLYFAAIALAAAGGPVGKSFRILVLPGDRFIREKSEQEFQPMTPREARDYLARLVADLLSESHAYFLPLEAAMKARSALADPAIAIVPLIEEIRQNEWGKCSSDYGPVRNTRLFAPPSEQKARRIIERRFGPLFECMAPAPSKKGKKA